MEVVSGSPRNVWAPVDGTDIAYVGQLVKSTGDGVGNAGSASGAADTTTKARLWGIVIGTNNNLVLILNFRTKKHLPQKLHKSLASVER